MKRLYIVISVLLAAPAALAADLTVVLRENAELKAGKITLADVAELRGEDALRDQLRGLRLGATPWPGNARRVTARDIRRAMVRQDIPPGDIQWAGARACVVTVRRVRVTGKQITDVARRHLADSLAKSGNRTEISLVRTPPDRLFSAGDAEPVLAPIGEPARPWGKVRAVVRIEIDGRVEGSVPVLFNVVTYRRVVVAARDISSGTRLTENDVTIRETALGADSTPDSAFFETDRVVGCRTVRPLTAGLPVTRSQIREPLAVHKGQLVSVVVDSAYVRVSTKAVAQSDGRVGDIVAVKVVNTGKTLQCRATGVGEATVRF